MDHQRKEEEIQVLHAVIVNDANEEIAQMEIIVNIVEGRIDVRTDN
jgi:hypothetical protein